MNFIYGIIFGISALMFLLLWRKTSNLANYWLLVYMGAVSVIFLLLSLNLSFGKDIPVFLSIIGGGSLFALLPASLFLYILTLTNRYRHYALLSLLPCLIHLTWYLSLYSIAEHQDRIWFIWGIMGFNPIFTWESALGIILMSLQVIFPILGLILIRHHKEDILNQFSDIEEIDLNWMRVLLWAVLIFTTVAVLLIGLVNLYDVFSFNLVFIIIFSLVALQTIYIGYHSISQSNIFSLANLPTAPAQKSEEHFDNAEFDRLNEFISASEIYKTNRLTIEQLSLACGLSVSTISNAIKIGTKKNFFEFINGYRVNSVINALKQPQNKSASLLAIGLENGFSSKSSFNKVFKEISGHPPSYYRKPRK